MERKKKDFFTVINKKKFERWLYKQKLKKVQFAKEIGIDGNFLAAILNRPIPIGNSIESKIKNVVGEFDFNKFEITKTISRKKLKNLHLRKY